MIPLYCFRRNKGGVSIDTVEQIFQAFSRIKERTALFEQHGEGICEGISLVEAHCIDKIGSMEHANVTKIAADMSMTRGAISKISKKLLCKQLISSYQKPENNKEIYFCLTEKGTQVYDIHKKCHEQVRREQVVVLSKYSKEEQQVILRFLNDINAAYDQQQL